MLWLYLHFWRMSASLRFPWLSEGTISISWSNPRRIFCRRFCSDAMWFAFFSASVNNSCGALRLRLPCGRADWGLDEELALLLLALPPPPAASAADDDSAPGGCCCCCWVALDAYVAIDGTNPRSGSPSACTPNFRGPKKFQESSSYLRRLHRRCWQDPSERSEKKEGRRSTRGTIAMKINITRKKK